MDGEDQRRRGAVFLFLGFADGRLHKRSAEVGVIQSIHFDVDPAVAFPGGHQQKGADEGLLVWKDFQLPAVGTRDLEVGCRDQDLNELTRVVARAVPGEGECDVAGFLF